MRSSRVMTLSSESTEQFRNWCIARARSKNTAKAYSTDLRMFLLWTQETRQMSEISPEEYSDLAMTWLNMTRETMSPKTTGRRLTSLRAFAKWANIPHELDEYQAPTPARAMPHPIPEGVEGLERMIEVASNSELKALVALMGFVGLRVHEALAMQTTWLDPKTMQLTVRGKGDKFRIVPVSKRAWDLISDAFTKAMCGDGTLIHYEDRSARKAITMMGQRARLSRSVSSHDLRATFATEVYNRTLDQRVVQELLGHSSSTQTEVYIGVKHYAMAAGVEF
jgi:site-specific recombinase XerD